MAGEDERGVLAEATDGRVRRARRTPLKTGLKVPCPRNDPLPRNWTCVRQTRHDELDECREHLC